jgi:hypothetical protein
MLTAPAPGRPLGCLTGQSCSTPALAGMAASSSSGGTALPSRLPRPEAATPRRHLASGLRRRVTREPPRDFRDRLGRQAALRHETSDAVTADEVEASGGARSKALPLLHRWTRSSDGVSAPIHHATERCARLRPIDGRAAASRGSGRLRRPWSDVRTGRHAVVRVAPSWRPHPVKTERALRGGAVGGRDDFAR